jgi:hypothetical protein
MSRRRLLSIGLLITAVLVGVGAFAGCGSSGSGRGEKVMDMNALAPDYGPFGLAASANGTLALAWIDGSGHLKVSELKPDTWHWSKPEVIASIALDYWPVTEQQVPLAYDGLGRLLVAWPNGQAKHGLYTDVEARVREADGKWEPARTLNRGQADGINVSSGKRSFAVGWYDASFGIVTNRKEVKFRDISGFRILRGNKWLSPVRVKEGQPVEVQLLGGRSPQALWILPAEKKLMDAPVLHNGKLGKARSLGKAWDCLVSASDSGQIVAGWYYNHGAWASVWSGASWTKPKNLGQWPDDSGARSPIATTASRGRAAVVWTEGWAYALWQHGKWSRKYSLPPTDLPSTNWGASGGWGVNAVSLHSGDIFLAGFGGVLQIVHTRASGRRTLQHYPINEGGNIESGQASASSARAVALAWSSDIGGFGDNPDEHLFVWVYRP